MCSTPEQRHAELQRTQANVDEAVCRSLCVHWWSANQLSAHCHLLYWTVYISKCVRARSKMTNMKAAQWEREGSQGRGSHCAQVRYKIITPNVKTVSSSITVKPTGHSKHSTLIMPTSHLTSLYGNCNLTVT